MPLFDQIALLCQAILEAGRQEAEAVLEEARERAARLVAAEEARRREEVSRSTAAVRAQAHLEARNLIDRAELESRRRLAQAKEGLLADVFQAGRERLASFRQSPEYPEWLRGRLAATVRQLGGERARVVANPEERQWLTPVLLEAVSRETGFHLDFEGDPEVPPGGFIMVRADGRVRYDQTFEGILRRQGEGLRSELARLIWQTG